MGKMKQERKDKRQKRDGSLDFLRGSAVFLMVITHINGVFLADTSHWLDGLTWWGATICFTVFLFVSGAVSGILLFNDKLRKRSLFRRSLQLLMVYLILGLLIVIINAQFLSDGLGTTGDDIVDFLLFLRIPLFIEFILSFSVYSLLTAIFSKQLKRLVKRPLLFLTGAIIIFGLSKSFFEIQVDNIFLSRIKSLLVGHNSEHVFGVFSYLPVWTIGLLWGYWKNKFKRKKRNVILGVTFIVTILMWAILYISEWSVWNRWPPTLFLFLYGFIYIIGTFLIYPLICKLRFLDKAFQYFGRYALQFYYYHVAIIIFVGSLLEFEKVAPRAVLVLIFLVFILCIVLNKAETRVKKYISSR
jgi:peptidoglycan/LPS O-acetylase OafA/YrhL